MQINSQFCTISGNVTWWTSILARSRRSDLRIPCEKLFNFNQIKLFVSLRISKQLYCAFIYSRIQYSIKAYAALMGSTHPYGSCAQRALIIEIDDVHIAKVLFFCKWMYIVNFYKIRVTGLYLRNRSSLDVPWAKTHMRLSLCDIKCARLWNQYLQITTNQLLNKRSIHKQLSKALIQTYDSL